MHEFKVTVSTGEGTSAEGTKKMIQALRWAERGRPVVVANRKGRRFECDGCGCLRISGRSSRCPKCGGKIACFVE